MSKNINSILKIQNNLYKLSDEKHKIFLKKLIPNKNEILGVKSKDILKLIKELSDKEIILFLEYSKYTFLEEIIMYAMILSRKSNNIDFVLKYIDNFKLMIDNWCSCDAFVYKLKNNHEKTIMWNYMKKNYFGNNNLYSIRLCIVIILKNFLEINYINKIFNFIKSINNNEYYCEMAISWLLSQMYFLDEEKTLYFIKNYTNKFIFKKSLQKICESKKINETKKESLKLLIKISSN